MITRRACQSYKSVTVTRIAPTVLTKRYAHHDSALLFSSGAQTRDACFYHKCAMERTTVLTTRMNFTASPLHVLEINTRVQTVAVYHASGCVTEVTIAEMKAMSHLVYVTVKPVTLSRVFSVTRHASAFLSVGPATEMVIVMIGQTRILRFAKVRNFFFSSNWPLGALISEPLFRVSSFGYRGFQCH